MPAAHARTLACSTNTKGAGLRNSSTLAINVLLQVGRAVAALFLLPLRTLRLLATAVGYSGSLGSVETPARPRSWQSASGIARYAPPEGLGLAALPPCMSEVVASGRAGAFSRPPGSWLLYFSVVEELVRLLYATNAFIETLALLGAAGACLYLAPQPVMLLVTSWVHTEGFVSVVSRLGLTFGDLDGGLGGEPGPSDHDELEAAQATAAGDASHGRRQVSEWINVSP